MFPELGTLDRIPLKLIGEEYRVRHRWGDRPSHAEFLARFRERLDPLRVELSRIDRELEDEASDDRALPPPESRPFPMEPPADQSLEGILFSDRDFLLERMIGAGRMGKIYQASRRGTTQALAVKFLRKSFLDHPWVVRRFIGEARTIAMLEHPNIVRIHGLGRTPAGSYFIVMNLVRGSDLAHIVRTRRVEVSEAVRWAIEICDALEHAHAKGIIHCDLKPANLVLDQDGCIRVTDFGLARSLTEPMQWTAEIEGTAPFMAPEQVSRSRGEIDERTDIYGIGAILFTLLTGRSPWIGQTLPDILADVISDASVIPPTRLRPDLPEPISELCRKCLSKAPGDRYDSVQDVRFALNELQSPHLSSNAGPAGSLRYQG